MRRSSLAVRYAAWHNPPILRSQRWSAILHAHISWACNLPKRKNAANRNVPSGSTSERMVRGEFKFFIIEPSVFRATMSFVRNALAANMLKRHWQPCGAAILRLRDKSLTNCASPAGNPHGSPWQTGAFLTGNEADKCDWADPSALLLAKYLGGATFTIDFRVTLISERIMKSCGGLEQNQKSCNSLAAHNSCGWQDGAM